MLIRFSAICCHHRRHFAILNLHALRSVRMAGKVHATNTNELGLPLIHPSSRRRVHRHSLDIRAIHPTPSREIYWDIEDLRHAEAEATQAIQTRA